MGIIGLGYVGLPLSLELGKHFNTIGYDIDNNHIKLLKKKIDKNKEVKAKDFNKSKLINFTSHFQDIHDCNFYIVALPTPVNKNNKPQIDNIKKLCIDIISILKKNDTIIFESSFAPGTINEILVPIIEKNSKGQFIYNKNFFVAYSPERINPGKNGKKLQEITKIVSASNANTLKKISYIYSKIIKKGLHKVKNIKIAEAAKMLENTQRDINIAFINEFSIILDKLNIDPIATFKAAETKWNFHKYRPGLVGGHCIGVDTNYLIDTCNKINFNPSILKHSRHINENMSLYYSNKIIKILKQNNLKSSSLKLLIYGFSFKENCSDIRNTKIFDLYNHLNKKFKVVHVFDSYVNKKDVIKNYKINFKEKLPNNYYNVVIFPVAHDYIKNINIKKIMKLTTKKHFLFDLKNIFSSKDFIRI